MRCFRAKLSDRRELTSPQQRHHGSGRQCQRRLANSTCDQEDWGKTYTTERYHLEVFSSNPSEYNKSRPPTPSSTESELPKTLTGMGSMKDIARSAFLTITNIDLPPTISAPTPESKIWSKKRPKYKMVPKHCSNHMHRMFVKNCDGGSEGEYSRGSSRASTDYDGAVFEEYLRTLNLPDDSSEFSLFELNEQLEPEQDATNNNDSHFINQNSDKQSKSAHTAKIKQTPNVNPDTESTNEFVHTPNKDRKTVEITSNRASSGATSTYKREKRKSITISRIPSPETVQIIRIDVITGYPVESDNSLLSEVTESELRHISDDNLLGEVNASELAEPEMYDNDASFDASLRNTSWKHVYCNDRSTAKKSGVDESLLNCKTVNLVNRL